MRFICTWCQLWIFWFYLTHKSQKSQEISIQRSLNNVKTLHDHESDHAEFSLMQQHHSLIATTHEDSKWRVIISKRWKDISRRIILN